MIVEIKNDSEGRMEKTIQAFKKDWTTIRTGRATPSLLDRITVNYYGVPTPLNQLAGISVPEPKLLVIQPWDKNAIKDMEKAILKSDLGLTPNNDGNVIRLAIPQLTEERRKELTKVVRKKAEEARVAIRNIRRDANDTLKSMSKESEITEDDEHKGQEEIQKITDSYIEKIDAILKGKEEEIMEV